MRGLQLPPPRGFVEGRPACGRPLRLRRTRTGASGCGVAAPPPALGHPVSGTRNARAHARVHTRTRPHGTRARSWWRGRRQTTGAPWTQTTGSACAAAWRPRGGEGRVQGERGAAAVGAQAEEPWRGGGPGHGCGHSSGRTTSVPPWGAVPACGSHQNKYGPSTTRPSRLIHARQCAWNVLEGVNHSSMPHRPLCQALPLCA